MNDLNTTRFSMRDAARAGGVGRIARRAFDGEILVFGGAAAVRRLIRATRQLARDCFDTADPRCAHRLYADDEFLARANRAQQAFRRDREWRKLFADVFAELGLDPTLLFHDSPRLRIAPPVAAYAAGTTSHVAAHRDTWGSGWQQQINWWGPVWPLSRRRTMGFYPRYWSRPLANTTANWSLREYTAACGAMKPGHAPDYPSSPRAVESPDAVMRPLVIAPGELACFSSAQLHGSVPNTTGLTRFSFEIRTVNFGDVHAGCAAPNVDCETAKPLLAVFARISDGVPLKQALPSLHPSHTPA